MSILYKIVLRIQEFSENPIGSNTYWKIEEIIEDYHVEQYIFGEWGGEYLPYDRALELKLLIVEFFHIYHSQDRTDAYSLVSPDAINTSTEFLDWQKRCRLATKKIETLLGGMRKTNDK